MSGGAYAQTAVSYVQPVAMQTEPVYLLNSTTIINGVFADFTAADIQEVEVYKPSLRQDTTVRLPWQATMGVGVLSIRSARQVRSRSLAQLGRRLNLRKPLVFAINGHPLAPDATAALRIAPAAIAQLHITEPTPGQPATQVDIWLRPLPKTDPSTHPPGTIFIR